MTFIFQSCVSLMTVTRVTLYIASVYSIFFSSYFLFLQSNDVATQRSEIDIICHRARSAGFTHYPPLLLLLLYSSLAPRAIRLPLNDRFLKTCSPHLEGAAAAAAAVVLDSCCFSSAKENINILSTRWKLERNLYDLDFSSSPSYSLFLFYQL